VSVLEEIGAPLAGQAVGFPRCGRGPCGTGLERPGADPEGQEEQGGGGSLAQEVAKGAALGAAAGAAAGGAAGAEAGSSGGTTAGLPEPSSCFWQAEAAPRPRTRIIKKGARRDMARS